MKNFYILLTSLISFFAAQCLAKNPDKDIVILYTNDVHCAVDKTIGYAGLSYYRSKMEEQTPYVTLVDAGDHVQGELIGSISTGSYIMDIMNAVNYDVVVPGNHEFDYGMDRFLEFTETLSCGYVSCNFRSLVDNKLVLEPYKMIKYGDVKVAYVGISTPESITKSTPVYFMDDDGNFIYDFDGDLTGEKLIKSVQKAVDDARKEGADFVIAVGHLGENGSVTKVWSSPYIIEHTKGIDALIDGHTHETTPSFIQKNLEGKEVPISQSGTKLAYIGKVIIGKDGNIKTSLVAPEEVESKDEKITKVIEDIKNSPDYGEKLGEIIGHSTFPLTNYEGEEWVIRKKETNLANIITDSLYEGSKQVGGCDLVLLNGGSIRTNITNEDITYGDALNVLPFPNLSCICEIPGQSIIDALEMGARNYPENNGGFLHTSGLTYAIDPTIQSSVVLDERNMFVKVAGKRRVHSVYVNGEPIDVEKKYRVYGDNYILLQNGDGYVFEGANLLEYAFSIPNQLFIAYLRDLKEVPEKYRYPQGRIIVAAQNEEVPTELPTEDPTEAPTEEPSDDSDSDEEVEVEATTGDVMEDVEDSSSDEEN